MLPVELACLDFYTDVCTVCASLLSMCASLLPVVLVCLDAKRMCVCVCVCVRFDCSLKSLLLIGSATTHASDVAMHTMEASVCVVQRPETLTRVSWCVPSVSLTRQTASVQSTVTTTLSSSAATAALSPCSSASAPHISVRHATRILGG